MSSDNVIPYDWARVVCSTCGAEPDKRCRAKSGRVTDAHSRRLRDGRQRVMYRQRFAEYGCQCSQPWTGIAPAYGRSAYAIRNGGSAHPHDPSDLCRCLKVSPFAPEHMRGKSPEWTALVDHWDELADMLKEEHPNGLAPRTYTRMKQLFEEAR